MSNILEEVQQYVADKLNADEQLSSCTFIAENRRDVEFQIKQALGKQGIIGLVMTPKATFAGAYMDASLVWQLDELEIDIVENVVINRGKQGDFITGQDAAMRLFDVLSPLSGKNEGQFSPVSYSEGEDNSLLVNKCILKCLVHKDQPPELRTKVTYTDSSTTYLSIDGVLNSESIPNIENVVNVEVGNSISSISDNTFSNCSNLTSVVLANTVKSLGWYSFYNCSNLANITMSNNLSNIGFYAFQSCSNLSSITIDSDIANIGLQAFLYCNSLTNITFSNKNKEAVQNMTHYSWGLTQGCIVHCTDGDITI